MPLCPAINGRGSRNVHLALFSLLLHFQVKRANHEQGPLIPPCPRPTSANFHDYASIMGNRDLELSKRYPYSSIFDQGRVFQTEKNTEGKSRTKKVCRKKGL